MRELIKVDDSVMFNRSLVSNILPKEFLLTDKEFKVIRVFEIDNKLFITIKGKETLSLEASKVSKIIWSDPQKIISISPLNHKTFEDKNWLNYEFDDRIISDVNYLRLISDVSDFIEIG